MAQQIRKPPNQQPIRPSNNAYKKGKLSKNARFSPRRIKWTPIIVLLCVLVTFILAMIVGNSLGKKADKLQNTTPTNGDVSNLTPPSADHQNPKNKLHASLMPTPKPAFLKSPQKQETRVTHFLCPLSTRTARLFILQARQASSVLLIKKT